MVAIIGGVKKCEREYIELLKKDNIKCKVFNTMCPDFKKKIEACETCVVFVNVVSHKLVKSCNEICKKKNIKLLYLKTNGVNALKENIEFLK